MEKINSDLRKYLETEIFPQYSKNDAGHNLDHILYTINRSLKFAEKLDNINYDMVFTVAAYHDIGHSIDAKNHEEVSAEFLSADRNLQKFFSPLEIKTMTEAVYDHRSTISGGPRSIYGKIISSADRNTKIEDALTRTYAYRKKHSPSASLSEIIEESRAHLLEKFGEAGYANDKIYFDDPDYSKFLKDISTLANDKEKFREAYLKINQLYF